MVIINAVPLFRWLLMVINGALKKQKASFFFWSIAFCGLAIALCLVTFVKAIVSIQASQ